MKSKAVEQVLRRITKPENKGIHCEEGWLPLILEIDRRLASLDSHYTIYWVGKRHGMLRFDINPFPIDVSQEAFDIINDVERRSLTICENCGKPGEECVDSKNNWFVKCQECMSLDMTTESKFNRKYGNAGNKWN